MCSQLKSDLHIFYVDDGTLGGAIHDVFYDLHFITKEGQSLDLQPNLDHLQQ